MASKLNPLNWFSRNKQIELKQDSGDSSKSGRRSARNVIRKVAPRQVSYQIADINKAINNARNPERPDRSLLFAIYRYVMRDARTKSQARGAKIKVMAEPYMFYNGANPDEALTEQFRKRWLNAIIGYIVEAEIEGFRVIELDAIDPEKGNIGEVIPIDGEYISIERQWILADGNINGAYLPYGEIMHELDLLEFGSRTDLGILLEVSYNVIWKYYSRSDWSRANERVGQPILSIVADTRDDEELDRYEDRAANFGTDGYVIGQKGDEINLIERKSDNFHKTFLDKISLCNEELTLAFNGQTATTDQKSFVGSAEVQERTFEDLTLARLQNVADEINEKVLPYLRVKGFAIPEEVRFDYPALIREREKKIKGETTPTDPKKTEEQKKEEKKPVTK